MSKGKLAKFAELNQMPNVFQNFSWAAPELQNCVLQLTDYRNQWHKQVFKNNHSIVLELACGYGEYTVAMSAMFPQKNFIGIDIKGNRIWTGAKTLLEKGQKNAAFLRSEIMLLHHFFGKNEISEIWITFPDPHIRESKHRKRLTSLRFLNLYRQFLLPNAMIHLKTDSDILYEYTLEVIEENSFHIHKNQADLYRSEDKNNPLLQVKTRYEKLNISGSNSIKYIAFSL